MEMDEPEFKSLIVSIDKTLRRQDSFWRTFMHGMVRGLGTALGASILLAIATSVTIRFVDSGTVLENMTEALYLEGG